MENLKRPKIAVVGFGNILMGDEGIGVHVIHELQKNYTSYPTSYTIELIDGGTSALDVILSLKDIDKLIIIDAIKNGSNPGDIYKFHLSQVNTVSQSCHDGIRGIQKSSLHDLNLIDALKIVEKLGTLPKEVIFIGVEPKKIEPNIELSEELKIKIPEITKTILYEVKQ
ncbi:MAG: HyaD/HybD family hydrogenase maturation endopeptidase [Elusimicrobiota bacterium]